VVVRVSARLAYSERATQLLVSSTRRSDHRNTTKQEPNKRKTKAFQVFTALRRVRIHRYMNNNDSKSGHDGDGQQTNRDSLIGRLARVTEHAHLAAERLGQPPLPTGVVIVFSVVNDSGSQAVNQRHVRILSEDNVLEIAASKLEVL
jgi:hypothetical protein